MQLFAANVFTKDSTNKNQWLEFQSGSLCFIPNQALLVKEEKYLRFDFPFV